MFACAAAYGACTSVLDHERDRAALTLAQRQRDLVHSLAAGEAHVWLANLDAAEDNLHQLVLLADSSELGGDPASRRHLQRVRAAWASLRADPAEVNAQAYLAQLSTELDALVAAYEQQQREHDRVGASRLAVLLAGATPLLVWALVAVSRNTAPPMTEPGPSPGREAREEVSARRRRLAAQLHEELTSSAGPSPDGPERIVAGLHAADDRGQRAAPAVRPGAQGDEQGLAHELRLYAADFRQITGLAVELAIDERAAALVPAPARPQALNIAREALCRIRRHASATRVSISLRGECGSVWLAVADDGTSSHPERPYGGEQSGLQLMRARAEQIGAELRISERHGAGTQVVVRLPVPEQPGEALAVARAPRRAF